MRVCILLVVCLLLVPGLAFSCEGSQALAFVTGPKSTEAQMCSSCKRELYCPGALCIASQKECGDWHIGSRGKGSLMCWAVCKDFFATSDRQDVDELMDFLAENQDIVQSNPQSGLDRQPGQQSTSSVRE